MLINRAFKSIITAMNSLLCWYFLEDMAMIPEMMDTHIYLHIESTILHQKIEFLCKNVHFLAASETSPHKWNCSPQVQLVCWRQIWYMNEEWIPACMRRSPWGSCPSLSCWLCVSDINTTRMLQKKKLNPPIALCIMHWV